MPELKKVRAVVLPCGSFHDDRPYYCGECRFWEYSEDKTESYKKPTGWCGPRSGSVHFANETACSDGRK